MGLWRPIPPRPAGRPRTRLRPRLAATPGFDPHAVRTAAVVAAAALDIKEAGDAPRRRSPPIANSPTRPAPKPSRPSINWPIPRRIEAAQRALLLPGIS